MRQQQILFFTTLLTLLSIVLCTTVFYYWPRNYQAVSMNIYTDDLGIYYHYTLEELLKDKQITQYQLTGYEGKDKEILKTFKYELRYLAHSKDTTKVIRFTFNKATNYQQFMDALDRCFIENAFYVYYKDDLWIMNKRLINKKNEHLFYDTAFTYNEQKSIITIKTKSDP